MTTTIAKIKSLWKIIKEYGRSIFLAVFLIFVAVDAVYFFGGFRGLGATGYFWYDMRRFGWWFYDTIIIPICLVNGAWGLWRLTLSLLPDDERNLPKYAQELKYQGSRFEDQISNLQDKNQRLQAIAHELEAKVEVVMRIISNEEERKISDDVLEDG